MPRLLCLVEKKRICVLYFVLCILCLVFCALCFVPCTLCLVGEKKNCALYLVSCVSCFVEKGGIWNLCPSYLVPRREKGEVFSNVSKRVRPPTQQKK